MYIYIYTYVYATNTVQQDIRVRAIVNRGSAISPPPASARGKRQPGKQATGYIYIYICMYIYIYMYNIWYMYMNIHL